MIYTSNILDR